MRLPNNPLIVRGNTRQKRLAITARRSLSHDTRSGCRDPLPRRRGYLLWCVLLQPAIELSPLVQPSSRPYGFVGAVSENVGARVSPASRAVLRCLEK